MDKITLKKPRIVIIIFILIAYQQLVENFVKSPERNITT